MKSHLIFLFALAGIIPANVVSYHFFSGIRSGHESFVPQEGRTCAARPYGRHSFQTREFRSARGTSGLIQPQSNPTGISCSASWGGDVAHRKSTEHFRQSIETNDTSSVCAHKYFVGSSASHYQQWQIAFDTLTYFIDSCPNNPNAPSAFESIGGALAGLYGPTFGNYRGTYLNWLESVLYSNTKNAEYFCQCVQQIAGSLPLPHDTTPGYQSRQTNIPLSVLSWLIHNTTCDTPVLSQEYDASRHSQLALWSNDPGAYKLDTTLLSLDSLQPGLQELLQKHFLYATVAPAGTPAILSNCTANPNPAQEGTVLSFGISKEAYVKIELYDILGHPVPGTGDRGPGTGFEGLFEPGNKSVPISLAGLPSGTYFARLVTAYGEVQSVKIVKE